MARVNKILFLIAVVALVMPLIRLSAPQTATAAGGIFNGGFETGEFSGWNVTIPPGGSAQVVNQYRSPSPPPAQYVAREGQFFALLKTDGPGSYTTVSQTFWADGGSTISGWAFFKAEDFMPFDDESMVEITVNSGGRVLATVFQARVSTVGNFGGTPWTYWSYTLPSRGAYTVQAQIANDFDSALDSRMGIDGMMLYTPPAKQQTRPSPVMPAATQAAVIVKNMEIAPREGHSGQAITISANMANDGDSAGGYSATLKINGKVEQTKMGAVEGHSAVPVSFTVYRTEPGDYTVDIGGQKGTFTILPSDGKATGAPRSGVLIAILIMGVLVLTTVVVLMLAFRRPA